MMTKKKDEQEIINPVGEIRAKVDGALREKIDALIQAFENERGKYFAELASLDQALNSLENKKSGLQAERMSVIKGIAKKGSFEIDLKLRGIEKEIKSATAMKESVFSKLTEIPELDFPFPFLNFLSRYEIKKGGF